ncbi:MAG: hypothetical protein KC501_30065, partial [Myxococcales bacterium]|nr:hypothetical protein [Myxococcales bacterium]
MPVTTAWLAQALGCGAPPEHDPLPHADSSSTGTTATGSSTAETETGPSPLDTSSTSRASGSTTAETEPVIYDVGGLGDLGPTGPVCTSDLQHVVDATTGVVLQTCPPHQGCADGRCVPACQAAAAAQGSVGCEFVVPTSPFYAN